LRGPLESIRSPDCASTRFSPILMPLHERNENLSMADRYFVEHAIEGQQARLLGAEAHHLAHVMRAKPGAEVTLFDGSGDEFLARVERVGRADIELCVLSRHAVDREPSVAMTLGVAMPKGDRRRWLVEKAVELGVARLVPLETARGKERESAPARLRQAAIEASKQCGRNRLMEIAASMPLADYVASAPAGGLRLFAHSSQHEARQRFDEVVQAQAMPSDIFLAVGPEGGFTPDELELALARRWRAVSLGPRVLRVETAALAMVAAVITRLERA
jgi:16S rRNA (uracil1498-N3)-methyltransferase